MEDETSLILLVAAIMNKAEGFIFVVDIVVRGKSTLVFLLMEVIVS